MKNVRLTIEYDGTDYAGWQIQDNAITIQQLVQEALEKLTREPIKLTGSGRTDSGVHALGQVANFKTRSTIPSERFSYALNAVLPRDIKVISSQGVPMDFHARFSAKEKTYRYCMLVNTHGSAIGHRFHVHVRPPLDIEAMNRASRAYIGSHDFAAMQATGSSVESTVRTIFESQLRSDGDYLYYSVRGNGFLYKMVRIMVGTLIEVGKGKINADDIPEILSSQARKKAGFTAAAKGLFLDRAYY
ncbi:MAG TPA: tRNA pseudouridine(38-40) synthase TruA [Bacillota bacterium]|nr:tRNA pseudouridine(38-40) synthase TruA [Bacillota bacterium]